MIIQVWWYPIECYKMIYLFNINCIGDKKASSDIKALVKGKNLKESDRVLVCLFLQQGGIFFFSGIFAAAMKKM